jgi:hypothetical protein
VADELLICTQTTPIPTFPLRGKESYSLPFRGRVRVGVVEEEA